MPYVVGFDFAQSAGITYSLTRADADRHLLFTQGEEFLFTTEEPRETWFTRIAEGDPEL